MRDLLSDLDNYAWPADWRYASDTVNDVSASSGNDNLDGNICKKILLFPYFLFFSGFQTWNIGLVYFIRIATSNTASDDVTK